MLRHARKSKDLSSPVVALPQLSGELHRELFVHSPEAIAVISPQGHFVEQNGAHFTLLGYSDAELLGKTPALHLGEKMFKRVMADLMRHGSFSGEMDSQTRDGRKLYLDVAVFVMRNSLGEPICCIETIRDITDRRRAQQHLALQYAVSRILSDSLSLATTSRRILQTLCAGLEWDLGGLWQVDRPADNLFCVDFWQKPGCSYDEFETVSRESRFARGLGLPGRVWATAQPTWIPNISDLNLPRSRYAAIAGLRGAFGFPIMIGGEVQGVIEFFSHDMKEPDEELLNLIAIVGGQMGQYQERMRAEKSLADLLEREQAARAEAERANRLKDEFLATLSHELRTPLNAVIGWTRMLQAGGLDEETSARALEVIERNAWAQRQIIEDILVVSRVVTGELRLHLGPVNLQSVVEVVLDSLAPALDAKRIDVTTVFDDEPAIVWGDADRLRQVVWNLLCNAAKFTPGNGRVEIRINRNESQLRIQVMDTGPGIAPEFLPYVFERFRQADGSTTRRYGGLGLGLAVVRQLVELHGGTISAENREAGGAMFTVGLPLPVHID